jgi:hypothetical protein
MQLILPIRPRRLQFRLGGGWERPAIRERQSEKELENLFNSLTPRLCLDSFSASPNKRIGADRRITRFYTTNNA